MNTQLTRRTGTATEPSPRASATPAGRTTPTACSVPRRRRRRRFWKLLPSWKRKRRTRRRRRRPKVVSNSKIYNSVNLSEVSEFIWKVTPEIPWQRDINRYPSCILQRRLDHLETRFCYVLLKILNQLWTIKVLMLFLSSSLPRTKNKLRESLQLSSLYSLQTKHHFNLQTYPPKSSFK